MNRRAGMVLYLVAVLAACAGTQHEAIREWVKVPDALPDKLDDQGLVVATIAANHLTITGFEKLAFSVAAVQIDGTHYANAVRDNYLILPLKPGEHTLDSLYIHRNPDDRAETR